MCRDQTDGMTLLEVLLVLAIGAGITVFSIQQYSAWRTKQDLMGVNANINTLFQAAYSYYAANCGLQNGPLGPSKLDAPQPVSVATLIQGGYLPATFPPSNPLVSAANAYLVQFNPSTMPRMQSVCANPPTCTTTTTAQIGTIIFWRIQVSVLMNNVTPNALAAYKALLQGDCLSAGVSADTVSACSANDTGTYIVFERLPSFAGTTLDVTTSNWISNPLIRQFTQMYTTYPMTYLTGTSHATEYQYFYCNN